MSRLLLALTLIVSSLYAQPVTVTPGADRLLTEYLSLVKGKRIGLVTNQTGLLKDGRHLADVLAARDDLKLVALFGPEHGVRGSMDEAVKDTMDAKTGVPVYSLYGKVHTPTPEMLRGVDVLLYDIQDVGARFYTYITTLGHVLEAGARENIPVIVLDRPNPIRGVRVEGPIAEDTLRSFVAFGPIPIAHGLTIGELARLYNGEKMLAGGKKAELTVVPIKGWQRTLWFDETDLTWIKPSPNMPSLVTATVYPGTCLFEGTNLSEGRGTPIPFEMIGAPWANGQKVADLLNHSGQKGVQYEAVTFTPSPVPWLVRPKYVGVQCSGVRMLVTRRDDFSPVEAGIRMLWAFKTVSPDSFAWRKGSIDRLAGTVGVREWLNAGEAPEQILARLRKGEERFIEIRKQYLLY